MTTDEKAARSAEITVLAHATEDLEKVKKALLSLLPPGEDAGAPEEQRLSGHYEDPITRMTLTLKRREAATLFTQVVRGLTPLDAQTVLDELADRVDTQGNLFLRLDKQAAYMGALSLQEHDPIRVKIKLNVPHKGDPVEAVREAVNRVRGAPE